LSPVVVPVLLGAPVRVPVKAAIPLLNMSVKGLNGFLVEPGVPVFGVVARGAPLTPGISGFGVVVALIRDVPGFGVSSMGSAGDGSLTRRAGAGAGAGSLTRGVTVPGGGGLLAAKGVLAAVRSGAMPKVKAVGGSLALIAGRKLKSNTIGPI
jgi:hypothetical protein